MDIHQILNNNVITTIDAEGQEFIAMGKGLAFSKKTGDKIDTKDIEKFFVAKNYREVEPPDNRNNELADEHLFIIEEIIQEAKSVLGEDFNKNLTSILSEHIYRVLEQHKEGIHPANILNTEIKIFYPQEYAVGLYALDQIEKKLKVKLPEDEAGFIALHLFAGQMNGDFHITQKMTVIIKEILSIIGHAFNISDDDETLNQFNFMTQLKYLSYKALNGIVYEVNRNVILSVTSNTSKEKLEIYECVIEIRGYLLKDYHYKMSKEDEFYLMVQISKLVSGNKYS